MNYCGSEISTRNFDGMPYPPEIPLRDHESLGRSLTARRRACALGIAIGILTGCKVSSDPSFLLYQEESYQNRLIKQCQNKFADHWNGLNPVTGEKVKCSIEVTGVQSEYDGNRDLTGCFVAFTEEAGNETTIRGNARLNPDEDIIEQINGSIFPNNGEGLTDGFSLVKIDNQGNIVLEGEQGESVKYPCYLNP